MRIKSLFIFVILASLFTFCSKKDDTVITPTPTNGNGDTEATAFTLKLHKIHPQLPNSVVSLLQVTDLDNKGVNFLLADRFLIFENNVKVDPVKANVFLMKKNDLNYTAKTKLMIDINAGTNLAVLKKGAIEFIKKIDFQQEIALYTLADTYAKIVDFTRDTDVLIAAVEALQEGNAGMDLYGSIIKANGEEKEEYTVDNIQQNSVVIFTDSNDDKGSHPIEFVHAANMSRQIYVIGLGSSLNASALGQIGTKSFYQATDEATLIQYADKVQTNLLKYANSFYWLSYFSAERGGASEEIKISIAGNTYSGAGSEVFTTFESTSFVDVENGLYVNWSYSNPTGVDLVMVMLNKSRTIQVMSMGGAKIPVFNYSVSDPAVATVAGGAGGRLSIYAKGSDGQECKLIIKDTANGLTKEITIRVVSFQMGVVLYEWWENISGTAIGDLTKNPRYPDNPTGTKELTKWEIDVDKMDNYGTRMRGFLHPPSTGKYTFWISSDDLSELWLSTDDKPENKVQICKVASWTGSREWTKETNQQSKAITLEAGKHYYMETLHKEGTGGDNLAVAWQGEGGKREVIGGDYLSLWIGN
ncbi:MAG: VWA domain-containing protein [Calditrichaeota bacterium]|nr:MAG: VWA domain-containing protein [Calditrichota bacterium]